jgi:starch phosphorylase
VQPQSFFLQVRPVFPPELARLEEVTGNLWFSWNAKARMLFFLMDPILWIMCGHNPRTFVRRIGQNRLEEMAHDRSFLSVYNGVLSDYDSYRNDANQWFKNSFKGAGSQQIAYFSAEFGLHESLPIYSGGLGILAGDHCKSASDLGLPFTAVGLLYRHGYFNQTIDAFGNQIVNYLETRFEDLCIEPALDGEGKQVTVQVELPGRQLNLQVWLAKAGHITMVLLDADVSSNSDEDRKITYQLYGGGIEDRIKQEICLGIGGVRALRAVGIHPTAWHVNEGHAAFIVLERMREHVKENGLNHNEALEATMASTVFTTHTPVPAGHDVFPPDIFDSYFGHFAAELGMSKSRLHSLGKADFGGEGFNQTALAIRGSAYQNGVAKLHGKVSSKMCQSLWPDVPPKENPMDAITNGVHVPSWLAPEWISAFDQHLGGQWRSRLLQPEFWQRIKDIPDYLYWSIHQTNKNRMLQYVRDHLLQQAKRNGESVQLVREMTALFDVRNLVIGFARRFATYKRATLLFRDTEKLLQILDGTEHPMIFLFAGKAHPADHPGQELLKRIHEISRRPEFMGRILMLESYDMTLSRYMISGVDVWLNNPLRPLEASGTSGMKAAMNGAPNLSILDGWWPEGFEGDNGWAIGGEREGGESEERDREDAASLYHILQHDVMPTYYRRNESGFSDEWVHISKRAMISSIPHFNTDRMVVEYTKRFYMPAIRMGEAMCENNFARAKKLATWKAKVRKIWPKLSLKRVDKTPMDIPMHYGDKMIVRVEAYLADMTPNDVRVEAVLSRPTRNGGYRDYSVIELAHVKDNLFETDIHPEDTGNFTFRLRMYPRHDDLPHPQSMGLMTWI